MSGAAPAGDAVRDAADWLRDRLPGRPFAGLILGSGMGSLGDALEDAVRIPYGRIPGFADPGVAGHAGVFSAGRLEGVACIALQGRYHLYEGRDPAMVGLPARVLAALGVRALVVTNAAGAVDRTLRPGDLMALDDHLNLQGANPLIGAVRAGEARFPDMAEPYDRRLLALAEAVALELGIPLRRGVYAAVLGPSYETPAEVRMLERFGAHAVGMSTVPEVLVAAAAGVPVLGLSLITNAAAGRSAQPLEHADVLEIAAAAAERLGRLLRGVLRRMPATLRA